MGLYLALELQKKGLKIVDKWRFACLILSLEKKCVLNSKNNKIHELNHQVLTYHAIKQINYIFQILDSGSDKTAKKRVQKTAFTWWQCLTNVLQIGNHHLRISVKTNGTKSISCKYCKLMFFQKNLIDKCELIWAE